MKLVILIRSLIGVCLLAGLVACSDGVEIEAGGSSDAQGGDADSGSGGDSGDGTSVGTGALPALSMHDDGFAGAHFSGAGQCSTCHDGLSDEAGTDVSIARDWSSSMMANAARDPYWIARVAAEIDSHPSLESDLQDSCTRCHAPMANESARKENVPLDLFDEQGLDASNSLFDHAMDGVSCTLCHQMEDDGLLGTPAGTSGNFSILTYDNASDRPAYGPYEDPNGVYMRTQIRFNALFGPHIATSESCAACHDLRTSSQHGDPDDSSGEAVTFFPEQMVFSEWRNSAYGTEGENPQNCQSCHMPEVPGAVMLATDGGGVPREAFSRHTFLGANTVMQNILMTYSSELGIRVESEQFEQSIARNRSFLQGSASVQIVDSELIGEELVSVVSVRNLAGHKLPSGYPSRRAFIHFQVKDSSGTTVFESGALANDGSIVGVDGDVDNGQYENHYQSIDSEQQVQVYEAIMSDEAEKVTHSQTEARGYLKDNRLLPVGLDKSTAPDDIRTVGLASSDADFDAGGDEITYRVQISDVGESYTVYAELIYQPLAYGHIQELFEYAHLPAVDQFKTMFDAASLKAEVIASDLKEDIR